MPHWLIVDDKENLCLNTLDWVIQNAMCCFTNISHEARVVLQEQKERVPKFILM
jgi:hypothetical protein